MLHSRMGTSQGMMANTHKCCICINKLNTFLNNKMKIPMTTITIDWRTHSNYLDCQMAAIMMTGVIETNTIQVWLFALCPGHRCKFHFEQRSAGHWLAQDRLLTNLDLLSIGFELLLGFVATRLDLLQHVPLWPFMLRMHW